MAKNSRKKFGSYPYLSVILSCCFTLFFLGLFGLFILSGNGLRKVLQNNIEVQIFLKKNIQENHRLQLTKFLTESAFTQKKEGNASIRYISKEDAAKKFIAETGKDFTQFLGSNPLRDCYVIKIAEGFQSNEQLKEIKTTLQKRSGVFEVSYIENLIGAINKNMKNASLVLLALFVLLLFLVSLLIHNTMKLSLYSQRFLIRSMQLVGAKAGFIYRPFLLKSLLYGLLSGILSAGLLYFSWQYALSKIPELRTVFSLDQHLVLYGSLPLVGIIICFWSTYHAVNKYLKMSLDELY